MYYYYYYFAALRAIEIPYKLVPESSSSLAKRVSLAAGGDSQLVRLTESERRVGLVKFVLMSIPDTSSITQVSVFFEYPNIQLF